MRRRLGGRQAEAGRALRQRGGPTAASPLVRGAGVVAALGLAVVATAPAGAQLPTLPGSTTTRPPPATTTTQPWPQDPGATTTQPPPPPPAPDPTPPPAEQPPPAGDPGTPPPAGAPPGAPAGEAPPAAAPGEAAPAGQPGHPGQPAAPGAPGAPGAGPPAAPGAAPAGGPAGDGGGAATPAPGEVPADARRAMGAVRRSGPNSTRRLLEALEPLRALGFSEEEVIAAGFGRFPVGGYATFTHDWFFPRFTPTFHLHEGTDIFAKTGTPVRAPADGKLRLAQGGSGGLAAYVYEPNGSYYYMAHLSAFVAGQKPGQQVRTGEIVGFVGDSGNAKGGSPHVHFEYHPAPTRTVVTGKGPSRTVTAVVRPVPVGSVLPPADPKALLDQWLADALAAAPQVVAAAQGRPEVAAAAAGGSAAPAPVAVVPVRAQLLWASSVSPSGGSVRLAEAAALDAASSYDWSEAARRHQELLADQVEALTRASAILAPLTPPALRRAPATDS